MKDIKVTLFDNLNEVEKEKTRAIAKAFYEIGIEAEKDSKKNCPVDTGRLRNSITFATSEHNSGKTYSYKDNKEKRFTENIGKVNNPNLLIVGTNVEYAEPNELRKHFLRNSLTNHKELYKDIMKKELEKN